MFVRRSVLFVFLALVAALPAARALPTAAQIAAALREIDTTENNAISPGEWQRASFALFHATDKNQNDFIDGAELQGSALAQDAATFRRVDTDGDGRLSIDEFMKLRRGIFAIADYNHDDYLTLLEFELLIVYEAVGWQERKENTRMPVAELRAALTKMVELQDQNRDSLLDPTEAAFMQPSHFTRFDRNKDGKLSFEELVAGYRAEFEA